MEAMVSDSPSKILKTAPRIVILGAVSLNAKNDCILLIPFSSKFVNSLQIIYLRTRILFIIKIFHPKFVTVPGQSPILPLFSAKTISKDFKK